ncbi:MAG: universal stress protein [Alphaproteobacteria bacterium]|nr:universal stress protein [Alphaproteobacteria bacterium]
MKIAISLEATDMKRILVATDFSARSDRAIRRATSLAKQFGVPLTLLHVVDDDQPQRIVEVQHNAALTLLRELAQTLHDVDGVKCDPQIVRGDAFAGIVTTGEHTGADLQVIGSHRRQVLRDVFVGTTAERAIRTSLRPTLMANAVPEGPYRHVLVAVDFSRSCRDAVRTLLELGLTSKTLVSAAHVFDTPDGSLMSRASLGPEEIKDYIDEERQRAAREMEAFLREAHLAPARVILAPKESSTGVTICNIAREVGADLIVAGTHGRTGILKLLLGSVAEEVLINSGVDVLAVPPGRR